MKTIGLLSVMLVMLACSEVASNNSTDSNELVSDLVTEAENKQVIDEVNDQDNDQMVTDEMADESKLSAEVSAMENVAKAVVEKGEQPVKNMVETALPDAAPEQIKSVEQMPEPTNVPLKPNHDNWDALLRANVSSAGKVNYNAMKSSKAAIQTYVTYLESFATMDSWTKNEKLAYWINLYNAATVRLIVENYPVASITDLSGGKPWDQNVVKVGGKSYTLNDIENKIIRPRFNDARIHFAVNCAAKSCPPLLNKAFTADNLTRYLDKQTKSFINGNENSISATKVEISKIFDWYKTDFKNGDLIAYLNKYSDTPINADAEIVYKEYDWALNK